MKTVALNQDIPVCGHYDVIVAGGGVAGVAASVSAARLKKNVLLIEKGTTLGG
ncbi:MAG: FAD-dependent oxidoreductase, partial [Clostridia bacterium]|nr:FAD-dependent oxidoreductase [Clostridia bacterium]